MNKEEFIKSELKQRILEIVYEKGEIRIWIK